VYGEWLPALQLLEFSRDYVHNHTFKLQLDVIIMLDSTYPQISIEIRVLSMFELHRRIELRCMNEDNILNSRHIDAWIVLEYRVKADVPWVWFETLCTENSLQTVNLSHLAVVVTTSIVTRVCIRVIWLAAGLHCRVSCPIKMKIPKSPFISRSHLTTGFHFWIGRATYVLRWFDAVKEFGNQTSGSK